MKSLIFLTLIILFCSCGGNDPMQESIEDQKLIESNKVLKEEFLFIPGEVRIQHQRVLTVNHNCHNGVNNDEFGLLFDPAIKTDFVNGMGNSSIALSLAGDVQIDSVTLAQAYTGVHADTLATIYTVYTSKNKTGSHQTRFYEMLTVSSDSIMFDTSQMIATIIDFKDSPNSIGKYVDKTRYTRPIPNFIGQTNIIPRGLLSGNNLPNIDTIPQLCHSYNVSNNFIVAETPDEYSIALNNQFTSKFMIGVNNAIGIGQVKARTFDYAGDNFYEIHVELKQDSAIPASTIFMFDWNIPKNIQDGLEYYVLILEDENGKIEKKVLKANTSGVPVKLGDE